MQQKSPSTNAKLSQDDVEKIVQHALIVEVPRPRATLRRSVRMHGIYSPETLAAMRALPSPISERERNEKNERISAGTADLRSTTVVTNPAKTPLKRQFAFENYGKRAK